MTPKPPIEPEEEKTLKKDEESDSKGILKNLTLKILLIPVNIAFIIMY